MPILGPYIGRQTYPVMGRPKTVDYWVASPGTDNGFTPDNEIDEIRWVTPEQAKAMLTYKRDVQIVRSALALPPTSPFVVLRHATATKRGDYSGKRDSDRPLTGKGRSEAKALVPLLRAFGIDRIHSSDAARCMQTVQTFASQAHVTIEQEPLFSEAGFEDKPKATLKRLESLVQSSHHIGVCSHRPVLPTLLQPLAAAAGKKDQSTFKEALAPAEMVVVHRRITRNGWDFVGAERHGS